MITNSVGKEVGICFAEPLPHLYDENPMNASSLYKDVAYWEVSIARFSEVF